MNKTYSHVTNIHYQNGTKKENVSQQGTAPSFKGYESIISNVMANDNVNWHSIFTAKTRKTAYSISMQLELIN